MRFLEHDNASPTKARVQAWTSDLSKVTILDGVPGKATRLDALGNTKHGIVVQDFDLTPVVPKYKQAVLCVNPTTYEVFYDFVDRPLTQLERLELLELENGRIKRSMDVMLAVQNDLMSILSEPDVPTE